jgi:hypothetical protein
VGAKADGPERAFKAVIGAIKRGDRASLARLSDSTQGEGTEDFEAQSTALFQQLEALKIVAVPKAYEVDGCWYFSRSYSLDQSRSSRPLCSRTGMMDPLVSCRHGHSN